MISFEIFNSTHDLNGIHTYQQNIIILSSQKGHLLIPQIGRKNRITLKILPSGNLSIKAHQPFTVNSRLYPDTTIIKKNDLIEVNHIKFKIHDFKPSKIESLKDLANQKVDKLIQEKSPLVSILQQIN